MMPYWIDYDRLLIALAVLCVLGVVLALVCLAVTRPAGRKAVAVALFGVVALGAAWEIRMIADARRTDCTNVEVFGARVAVPGCPES